MPVKCKICGSVFNKLITNTHLKKHNMTTNDYKIKYGEDSISCPEYRKARSEKYKGENNPNFDNKWTDEQKSQLSKQLKGREAHNKGKPMSAEQKEKQSNTMKSKYQSGEIEIWNKGGTVPEDTRKKISESVKKYAEENKECLSNRGRKAYLSKVENYGIERTLDDLKNARNKISPEGKKRQKESLIRQNKKKSEKSKDNLQNKIKYNGFHILDYDEVKKYLRIQCDCGKIVETSKQMFDEYRYKKDYCQFCVPKNRSRMEIELAEFVEELLGLDKVVTNTKTQIYPYELDIFVPDLNIAIEFCGLYWHSELFGKPKDYHLNKLDLCRKKGIDLIQVFENEWLYKKAIVKSMIKNKLGVTKNRIFARKCKVVEIPSKLANKFLNENHLQGSGRSNSRYGLYYEDELISVMTFSKENITRGLKTWEINRYSVKKDYHVVGGASKLFSAFIKSENPKEVVSFSDLRFGNGNVYGLLGFNKESESKPNYYYFRVVSGKDYLEVKHRYALRKGYKEGLDDLNKTEWENRIEQGWNRIFDCGHAKWIWKK